MGRPVRPFLLALALGLPAAGCLVPDEASDGPAARQGQPTPDAAPGDAAPTADGGPAVDAAVDTDAEVIDAAPTDAALDPDATADAAPPDAGPPVDAGPPPVERPVACGDPTTLNVGAAGAAVTVGAAGGALVDTTLNVPPGALAADTTLTIACDPAPIVDLDRVVAAGPVTRVTAPAPLPLAASARLTLVLDAAGLPEGLRPDHLRLFWKPDRYPGVAEPPLVNPVIDLRAGTVTFETPGLGDFQLGYPPDAGQPIERRLTWRAITGVSMGAGAAMYLGTRYAEHFDYIAPLGGPTDWPYLMRYIRERLLGGFCTAASPEGVGAWCGLPPPTEPYEHDSTYLDWFFADNGGRFDREEYVQIFQDLAYAYGNPFLYNDQSPYRPPGMPRDELLRPKPERCAAECRGDDCPAPATFTIATGFYDDEYNPDGTLPVIAYCDGEDGEPLGVFDDAVRHRDPVEVLMAVDVNGNGRRDAHEPVLRNPFEPFADVGCDGVPSSLEPGYDPITAPDPAGDDYDWYRNPRGTEGNWLFDGPDRCGAGTTEPYEDVGLDGVPDTPQLADGGYDFGEGNGRFDANPNYARFIERSGGLIFAELPAADRARLRVWADGGIRDIFNFATATNHLMGRLQGAGQNVRIYDRFPTILPTDDEVFVPELATPDPFGALGQSVFVRYGDPEADALAIDMGDGAHVGTVPQAINRFITMFDWVHNRWPEGDRAPVPPPFEREDTVVFFHSERLGKTYRYGLSLPPGYGRAENAEVRYPVVLLLHGYGQGPEDLPVAGTLLAGFMASGNWQKSILVYPEGFCGDSDAYQCNDGVDNDGDGLVDAGNDRLRRRACEDDGDCNGDYTCRDNHMGLGRFCCPPDWTHCGPPEQEVCGNRQSGRSESGEAVTLCSDGVDNDLDGRTDLDDQGCMGRPEQDTEADCKQGSFYTTHVAGRDGEAGGPDFEGALLDLLEHLDANYRTRRPETITVRR